MGDDPNSRLVSLWCSFSVFVVYLPINLWCVCGVSLVSFVVSLWCSNHYNNEMSRDIVLTTFPIDIKTKSDLICRLSADSRHLTSVTLK